jgi:hypothetical protein
MDSQVEDSLEAITNLIYLAQKTASSNLDAALTFLDMAEKQVKVLAEHLLNNNAPFDS